MSAQKSPKSVSQSFQALVLALQRYWSRQGCVILQPYDMEVGAGTFHPATFLRAIGPEPWRTAYVQPSRRPTDGRYGENPNRLQHYYQFQVCSNPALTTSRNCIWIRCANWVSTRWSTTSASSRTTGNRRRSAPGVWAGKSGSMAWKSPSSPISSRSAAWIANRSAAKSPTAWNAWRCICKTCESVFDLVWTDGPAGRVTYGDVFHQNEVEMSAYNFEHADVDELFKAFDHYEKESQSLIEHDLPLPAYELMLKASHTFNLLDARSAIAVTERQRFMLRVRALARAVAEAYYARREGLGFPLLAGGRA